MDKVDNRKIECMVCASCTFKGKKRQEVWKRGGDGGEAGRTVQGSVEEERREIVEKLYKKGTSGSRRNRERTETTVRKLIRIERKEWKKQEQKNAGINSRTSAESMVIQRFPQGFMYEMLKLHEVIE